MTVKPTISLTDQAHDFARSLVEKGQFASLSAVVQHGLQLIQREEAKHQALLSAIRADLDRRAEAKSMSTEEMDEELTAWRTERGDVGPADVA
ncbi:MAG: type II toxin-antitoxin system ParD family antitoxin [Pseudomonadota bacterium]